MIDSLRPAIELTVAKKKKEQDGDKKPEEEPGFLQKYVRINSQLLSLLLFSEEIIHLLG